MNAISEFIQETLGPLGPLGMLLLSFLDSTLLPLPHITDAAVLLAASVSPAQAMAYGLCAWLGSVLGLSALFYVGRRGGTALLRKRFSEQQIQRARQKVARAHTPAVLLACLMPPPFPLKMVVLAAGAFGTRFSYYLIAVLFGRAVRFFGTALVGKLWGDEFLQAISDHPLLLVAVIALLLLVSYVVYRFGKKLLGGNNHALNDESAGPR